MKIIDFVLLILFFIVLGFGVYFILNYTTYFAEPSQYEPFEASEQPGIVANGTLFYPNLRYVNKRISYSISDSCDEGRREDVQKAFGILMENTILEFYPIQSKAEILVLCSEIAPEPEQKGHFVAGEGGPVEIIDAGRYNVIYTGKISLYREEKCDEPLIAMHEILHALGFDHNSFRNSIMYPITDCSQKLDQYIIDDLNQLYSQEPLSDLMIDSVTAVKTGRYLNFNINVSNIGLKEASDVSLKISSNGEEIKVFEMTDLTIGTKKYLDVENLRVPSDAREIEFDISTKDVEISYENNVARIKLS